MCHDHTLLGHNVTSTNNYNFSMTSITPGFRQARILAESYVFFQNIKNDSIDNSCYDKIYNKFRLKYQRYSLGSYFNENYWNNSNYAEDYWSSHRVTRGLGSTLYVFPTIGQLMGVIYLKMLLMMVMQCMIADLQK